MSCTPLVQGLLTHIWHMSGPLSSVGNFSTEDCDEQSDSEKSCQLTACLGTSTVLMHSLCNQLQLTTFWFHQPKLAVGSYSTPKVGSCLVIWWNLGSEFRNVMDKKIRTGMAKEKSWVVGDEGIWRYGCEGPQNRDLEWIGQETSCFQVAQQLPLSCGLEHINNF